MGAINVKHTGSGADIALSSDGTSLLLDGTAIGGASAIPVNSRTSNYTIQTSDLGKLVKNISTGDKLLSLPSAAANAGFYFWVGSSSSGGVELEPWGSNKIAGSGNNYVLAAGIYAKLVSSGSDWIIISAPIGSRNAGITIGSNSFCNGADGIALGTRAVSNSSKAIAIGMGTSSADRVVAGSSNSTAIGFNSSGLGSITSAGSGAMALGGSYASGTDSFAAAIGNNTSTYGATGANSIAMGDRSSASGLRGIAIGGFGALASGAQSLAFGYQATANQIYSSGFGYASKAYGQYSWAGTESHASGLKSAALGLGTTSTSYGALHDNGIAIGYEATTSAAKQIALGSSLAQVKVSGAYTLPTADGTANQVLTTDGAGAVTFATAAGGSPDLFAESYDGTSTLPSATGGNNAVAIGSRAVSSGSGSVALGLSKASGANSFAALLSNTGSIYAASSSNSIAIGAYARSASTGAIGIGYSPQPNATYATVIGGSAHECTASYSSCLGGYANRADGAYSVATGEWARARTVGSSAHASGRFSSQGDAQTQLFVLRSDTTNATAEALTADNSTAGTTNQIVLPNSSAYAFHGTIVARQKASEGTASAAWKVEGLIRREGSAGTTVLVNSATTVLDNTPAWGMALTADTTNGGLAITITGAAATNIRWVATVNTSEVTYA